MGLEGVHVAEVLPIETPGLGDRSYLVHDGSAAVVIDPQRDTDRVTALAAEHGVRITHIAETHIHNDYLTGGPALAAATGAAYLVNAADPVAFDRTPVRDGDTAEVGDALRLRALATPGHTFTHLSYVLESGGQVAGVFTGGSLLYGTTGRPDLLGPEHTGALARAQYASAHRLARLPGTTPVFPTHGFGSFCSAGQSGGRSSTIAAEMQANPVLTLDEREYTGGLLAGLDAWPAYYAHMGPANLAGPPGADLSPPQPGRGRRGPPPPRRRRVGDRPAGSDRVRGRFPAGFCQLPAGGQLRQLCGLDRPVGRAADAARRDAGAGGTGAAGAGQDLGRPARRGGQRGPAAVGGRHPARVAAAGQVRRPGGGDDRPGARRCWMSGCRWSGPGATSPVPGTSRCTSWPAGPASCPLASCGCTARAGTARSWPRHCWPAVGAR